MGTSARIVALWGIASVTIVLSQAIVRLAPRAIEPWLDGSMTAAQIALYVAFVVFNAWAEGYRGFQQRFCPRVVARAFHLGRHPRPLRVLFAPAYCMSLFHARTRTIVVGWALVALLVVVVALVRFVPQPWRGIIDGGVVVGLGWGILALWWIFARAWRRGAPEPEDLPV